MNFSAADKAGIEAEEWSLSTPTVNLAPNFGFERVIVLTPEDLRAAITELLSVPDWIGTDTETTGLEPRKGDLIRLVQLASRRLSRTYICDMFAIGDHTPFIDLFASKMHIFVFQNGMFDFTFFLYQWGIFPERIFDTMLADKLLTPFYKKPGEFGKPQPEYDPDDEVWQKQDHGLDDIVSRRLGLFLAKEHQKSDWSGSLTPQQYDYAGTDAEVLLPLVDNIAKKIEREGMQDALRTENRLVLVSAQMKLRGMKVDRAELEALETEILTKIAAAEVTLSSYLPNPQLSLFEEVTTINLHKRGQLLIAVNRELNKARQKIIDEKIDIQPSQQAMIEQPLKLKSTKVQVLKEYRWLCPEMVGAYSEWKTLDKIYSSNLLNLKKAIDPNTDRVYWDVWQLGQPTHRYTFTNPNLLNVPKTISYGPGVSNHDSPRYSERSFRSLFIAEPGMKLCIADYDSAQLRILINHCGDEDMIRDLNNGVDLHARAAELAFKRKVTKEDKTERAGGKAVNFCVLFTGGPLRFKNFLLGMFDIDITLEAATEIVKSYKAAKPGVVAYHKSQVAKVRRTRRIRVKGGRCVIVHKACDLYSETVNFPQVLVEQSGIKRAMGDIAREFISKRLKAQIICYIYDELITEQPEHESTEVKEIVERQMKQALDLYMGPHVYSDCEAGITDRWSEK